MIVPMIKFAVVNAHIIKMTLLVNYKEHKSGATKSAHHLKGSLYSTWLYYLDMI